MQFLLVCGGVGWGGGGHMMRLLAGSWVGGVCAGTGLHMQGRARENISPVQCTWKHQPSAVQCRGGQAGGRVCTWIRGSRLWVLSLRARALQHSIPVGSEPAVPTFRVEASTMAKSKFQKVDATLSR